MANFFKKLLFFFQRPPLILITGKESEPVSKAILRVLKSSKVKVIVNGNLPWVLSQEEVIIFKTKKISPKILNGLKFFLKRSSKPVLIVTRLGEIPKERCFFSGEKKDSFCSRKLAEVLPARGFCILNFDDETVKEIENETVARVLTYGFQKRADVQATALNIDSEGINFKANYEGYTVPFWLQKISGKSYVYNALAAVGVATVFDVNLVEVSQALKEINFVDKRPNL